ncbi:MAG: putative glycosyltransferase [Pedosphaera sp.]|nr:putative glycosyltransferase [Pedosphaera sp.]
MLVPNPRLKFMPAVDSSSQRVTVDGKFFRLGPDKFFIKGITYGPFAPNDLTGTFASPEQTARDFSHIRRLGANLLRVYYVPSEWFLDLAAEHGLKLLIDIPWPKHLCFFESEETLAEARETVRKAVADCKGHTAVFAYSVVNEIPAEIVRWSGIARVARFIDELVDEAKAVDPGCLCTFASFPPTESLNPRNIDFVCFNVYLHQRGSFEGYLGRLQMLANARPLVLGEFGLDSLREGEDKKCAILAWQIESTFRAGLAGTVIYSYTDDWHRGGQQIENWAFGLTTRERQPKESFATVQNLFAAAPYFPLLRQPRVSVVVASYNGAKTLEACLASLTRLNYPDYEVILVDDGSKDNTTEIAQRHPCVSTIRQTNHGLSVARNVGIAAATGEIVAFTDSDCRADEDWLYYLVSDLLNSDFVGIGGHNFLPPEDSPVAAAVLVSPGGPAHVMLTDREAEHIPGCNMAFYKWALDEIGGFDPIFRKAGDDVDVCWRLQERGHRIGFSASGFVWHYRRSTVQAYLSQQGGYGEAEALLSRKHPEYFNAFGGGIWRGRIYTASNFGVVLRRDVIYHGIFGSGFFQKLYTAPPAHALMLCTSLEYHALVNVPLLALSLSFPFFLSMAVTSILASLGICVAAACQADLPAKKRRFWSRPLIFWLFFRQPIARGWARYNTQLHLHLLPQTANSIKDPVLANESEIQPQICFWSRNGVDRYAFLSRMLSNLETWNWQTKLDSGWDDHDIEILRTRWAYLSLTTVNEYLAQGRIFLRCRLRAHWSGFAKILFIAALISELLVIAFVSNLQPWIWMMLLTLPILAWFLDDEKRYQYQLIAALVDETASQLKLDKYQAEQEVKSSSGSEIIDSLHSPMQK